MATKRVSSATVIIGGIWLYALKGAADPINKYINNSEERIRLPDCVKWEYIVLPDLYWRTKL